LNIKKLRNYTGGGEATTLKHYADPVSEVDRRQAAYLPELTGAAAPTIPTTY
jgi:hypothetical protein